MKYWNGYSWREWVEPDPWSVAAQRRWGHVFVVRASNEVPPTSAVLVLPDKPLVVIKNADFRPLGTPPETMEELQSFSAPEELSSDKSEDCDHPGEPCVVGGPRANHSW